MGGGESPYLALVRRQPGGWFTAYTKRRGGKQVADSCRHRHATAVEALACATYLAAIRNDGEAEI